MLTHGGHSQPPPHLGNRPYPGAISALLTLVVCIARASKAFVSAVSGVDHLRDYQLIPGALGIVVAVQVVVAALVTVEHARLIVRVGAWGGRYGTDISNVCLRVGVWGGRYGTDISNVCLKIGAWGGMYGTDISNLCLRIGAWVGRYVTDISNVCLKVGA